MRRILMPSLLLIFLWSTSPLHADMANQLKDHASPYLAMHGDDPVAWQAWEPQVLQRAQQENKLIFISIGYFSCHWCHVMQRESYKDAAIAKHLNANFIPVKVDRELDPALDAYLIEFVSKTRGYAGWPLNVFLTPDGHPVVGIVYLPKDQFFSLLTQLDDLWRKDAASLKQIAAQAAAEQQGEAAFAVLPLEKDIGGLLHSQLLQHVMQVADEMQGGFGDQAKFPMAAQLNYLLTTYEQHPLEIVGGFVQLTLEQMATQGLRDHIGGGFFRYTVDPDWQTPHFEKMLYDNALLAQLYLRAGKAFNRKDFEAIGREALDFMLRELSSEKGGMYASLSAVDDNNIEGGYYLWTPQALKKMLTPQEYEVVFLLWNLQQTSRFDAGFLPKYAIAPDEVAKKLGLSTEKVMELLAQTQTKLFKARQSRVVPVDHKQLAAWNALALAALVQGAKLMQGKKYRLAAQKIRNFLVNQLWDGRRLARARNQGKEIAQAGLEDYSYAAYALLQWAQLVDDDKDRQLAKQWVQTAWQRFFIASGWRLSDSMLLPQQLGVAVMEDNPMPSPSALVIATSLQLAELQNDEQLRQRATNALAISQEVLKKQPFSYATQIGLIPRVP